VFNRLLSLCFIVFVVTVIIFSEIGHAPASLATIQRPVLTLPGIDVYEFNTPGQMHCVLAVDRASKFARTPALSCIKISALKVDPRRWEKALPTPDQGT